LNPEPLPPVNGYENDIFLLLKLSGALPGQKRLIKMRKKLLYIYRYLYWALSRIFVVMYIRPKFNLVKEEKFDKIPKPPFIMVSNHGTFFDPWIIGHYSRYPVSIMNNEDAFHSPPIIRWYLRNIGTFPKKKGGSDYKAMKTTLQRLYDGYPVLIFPEGQTTWDGSSQAIFSGIEKIIKRSKSSLVMMKIRGNFLSKPWWATAYRKGAVRVQCTVLTPEQLSVLTEQEILETIAGNIRHNDILDERNKTTPFTGKNLTGGLQRFLWICKNCLGEDGLTTEGNLVICSKCNAAWNMDSHFLFTPVNEKTPAIGTLYDWSLWHKLIVKEKIIKTGAREVLTTSQPVIYCTMDNNGAFINFASGSLTLTKESLAFDASDAAQSMTFAVKDITEYVYQRKEVFECRVHEKAFRFRIVGHSPMKWVYYFRYLNNYEDIEKRGYL
jgi:1-acyl-sn-glycerol-3-phosphate acyltransferase